jgi:Reverse transcriptase (RNA-dependent DNA polymerase)
VALCFDDLFSTVVSPRGLTNTFDSDEWRRLVSTGLERYDYKDYNNNDVRLAPPSLAPEWHPNDDDDSSAVSHVFPSPPLPELGRTLPAKPPNRTLSDVVKDIVKDMSLTSQTEGADEVVVNPPMPAPEGEVIDTTDDVWDQAPVEDVPDPDPAPIATNIDEQNNELEEPAIGQNLRHSSRLCRPNSCLLGPEWTNVASSGQYKPCRKVRLGVLNDQFLQALDWQSYRKEGTSMSFVMRQMMQSLAAHTNPVSDTVEWMHPMVLGAAANDADNPTWAEAMNGPNAQGFCDAMDKEIKTLKQDKDAWDVVKREPSMNVLPSTWAFKVKRLPVGTVRKLKAWFCVRGDRQVQNVDYFETFCPVMSWTTLRLMLIMSSILVSTRPRAF